MKKSFLFMLSSALILLAGCSNPTDYNTSIMNEVSKVERADEKIFEEITSRNFEHTEIALQEGRDQITSSLRKLDRAGSFRDDDALRQAAVGYISYYESLFKGDYPIVLDIMKKGKRLKAEDEQELEKLLNSFEQNKRDAKNTFIMIHFDFIKKNGLTPIQAR
jgi:hypothetical protein